jgi:hypothetical protein
VRDELANGDCYLHAGSSPSSTTCERDRRRDYPHSNGIAVKYPSLGRKVRRVMPPLSGGA